MNRTEELKRTLLNVCLKRSAALVDSCDFTQPDDMDEATSGGVWDFSREIADEILTVFYNNESVPDTDWLSAMDQLAELLYNLLAQYKKD